MAINFDKITPGSILLDVRRERMGNTTMRQWACWRVKVISVDAEKRTAQVSWNGNAPEKWREYQLRRLYLRAPKGYREQCVEHGREPDEGYLASPTTTRG